MREIKLRKAFKQDIKRESMGKNRLVVKNELWDVVNILAEDLPLDPSYDDHPLHHNWEGSRECHLRPNFLLVYTYIDDDVLRLERLGTHSEIFGL